MSRAREIAKQATVYKVASSKHVWLQVSTVKAERHGLHHGAGTEVGGNAEAMRTSE